MKNLNCQQRGQAHTSVDYLSCKKLIIRLEMLQVKQVCLLMTSLAHSNLIPVTLQCFEWTCSKSRLVLSLSF